MNGIALLQALYDSEINFTISTLWDGGFDWKLGDEMNGIKARGTAPSLAVAELHLAIAASIHYPLSVFRDQATFAVLEEKL